LKSEDNIREFFSAISESERERWRVLIEENRKKRGIATFAELVNGLPDAERKSLLEVRTRDLLKSDFHDRR